MGYVEQTMADGEEIVHRSRLHWVEYLIAAQFIAVAGVIFALETYGVVKVTTTARFVVLAVAALLLLIGIVKIIGTMIARWTTEFAVTSHRVVSKRGLIRRDVVEIAIEKVEGVDLQQGIIGRLLGFGTVVFRGTGEGSNAMVGVDDPPAFTQAVRAEVRAYREWAASRR